jgi:hypothetical protein
MLIEKKLGQGVVAVPKMTWVRNQTREFVCTMLAFVVVCDCLLETNPTVKVTYLPASTSVLRLGGVEECSQAL